MLVVSAQLAFNKASPVSSTRDQTASKPGLATCFLLQQTLLTAGRYRARREEQSNQSTFRTKAPVQLSSEICSLGQLPKGLHQLRFVLALGTSKIRDVLRREICLPRKKSPWEERGDCCPRNGCGAVLWMEGRSQTCIFHSSNFYARRSPAWLLACLQTSVDGWTHRPPRASAERRRRGRSGLKKRQKGPFDD